MQIELSFEGAKKIGRVFLVTANLLAFGAAAHYVHYRYTSRDFFEVLEFDVNNRLPDIRVQYQAVLKAEQDKAQKEAAAKEAEGPETTTLK